MEYYGVVHKPILDRLLNQNGIAHSSLIWHNFRSSTLGYVELSAPYVIMYEAFDRVHDRTSVLEFTESNQYSYQCPFSELMGHPLPLHFHEFYELTYVLSGELRMQIEGEARTYHAGECCICNKGIRHAELQDFDYEIVLFMLKEDYLLDFLRQDILSDKGGAQNTPRYHHFMRLFDEDGDSAPASTKKYLDFILKDGIRQSEIFDPLLQQTNNMLAVLERPQAGQAYFMKGFFCQFLSLLNDSPDHEITLHELPLLQDERLFNSICIYLEQHPGHINRRELEQDLNYSGDHINRTVKRHTGMPLMEFSRKFTLEKAEYLLRETDIGIGEICEMLGYSNRTFFNKLFTERNHMTPMKYRKQYERIS